MFSMSRASVPQSKHQMTHFFWHSLPEETEEKRGGGGQTIRMKPLLSVNELVDSRRKVIDKTTATLNPEYPDKVRHDAAIRLQSIRMHFDDVPDPEHQDKLNDDLIRKFLPRVVDAMTDDPLVGVRWRCVQKLGEVKWRRESFQDVVEDFAQMVAKRLRDKEWQVRCRAIEALRKMGKASRCAHAIGAALRDDNWQVQRAAAHAIKDFNVSVIHSMLDDIIVPIAFETEDTLVRQRLLQGMRRLISATSRGGVRIPRSMNVYITRELESEDIKRQMSACIALRQLGVYAGGYAKEVAMLLATCQDESLQLEAIRALGNMGVMGRTALAQLMALLKAPQSDMRQYTVGALGRISDADYCASQLAKLAVTDPSPSVRRRCVRALGDFGKSGSEQVGAIVTATHDSNRKVREAAVQALSMIGNAAVEHLLMHIIEMGPDAPDRFHYMRIASSFHTVSEDLTCAFLAEWMTNRIQKIPVQGVQEVSYSDHIHHSSGEVHFPFAILNKPDSATYVVFQGNNDPLDWLYAYDRGFTISFARDASLFTHLPAYDRACATAQIVSQRLHDVLRPGKHLYLVGHSRGGIAACVMALLICLGIDPVADNKVIQNFLRISVVTFGAPNFCVGSKKSVKAGLCLKELRNLLAVDPRTMSMCSWVIDSDPVPAATGPRAQEVLEFFEKTESWVKVMSGTSPFREQLGGEGIVNAKSMESLLPLTTLSCRLDSESESGQGSEAATRSGSVRKRLGNKAFVENVAEEDDDSSQLSHIVSAMVYYTQALCVSMLQNSREASLSKVDVGTKQMDKWLLPHAFRVWKEQWRPSRRQIICSCGHVFKEQEIECSKCGKLPHKDNEYLSDHSSSHSSTSSGLSEADYLASVTTFSRSRRGVGSLAIGNRDS